MVTGNPPTWDPMIGFQWCFWPPADKSCLGPTPLFHLPVCTLVVKYHRVAFCSLPTVPFTWSHLDPVSMISTRIESGHVLQLLFFLLPWLLCFTATPSAPQNLTHPLLSSLACMEQCLHNLWGSTVLPHKMLYSGKEIMKTYFLSFLAYLSQ